MKNIFLTINPPKYPLDGFRKDPGLNLEISGIEDGIESSFQEVLRALKKGW